MIINICDYNKDWGPVVEIAANSGIQFLDFHFDSTSLKGFESGFYEAQNENGNVVLNKSDIESHSGGDVQYSISSQDVLTTYIERWVPIPYFSSDQARSDGGPYNWARARLVKNPDEDAGSLLLQIALDTTVLMDGDPQDYLQPSFVDADVEREFNFSSEFEIVKRGL